MHTLQLIPIYKSGASNVDSFDLENGPAAGSGVLAHPETGRSVVSLCENEHYQAALLQKTLESFLGLTFGSVAVLVSST
jgi:hypothetical protein